MHWSGFFDSFQLPRLDAAAACGILSAALLLPQAASGGATGWHDQGQAEVARARQLPRAERARNVILFVGDGMGLSTVTAARIFEGQLRGNPGEENLLSFERLPYLAAVKTYNTDQQVPDSAGTMTAIVTGAKTRSGLLALDETVARGDWRGAAGHELVTLVERAEQRGLATGVVTTTSVTHATPAATYAHVAQRDWEDDSELPRAARRAGYPDIARQLVEFPHGDGIDVVLGGGRRRFRPTSAADPEYRDKRGKRLDGRDLIEEWLEARPGASYIWNQKQFDAIDWHRAGPVLGLFEDSHLQFEAQRRDRDRAGEPSLAELTAAAVERLQAFDRGYVLVVESGRIDHAHHFNSAYLALHETVELSRAVAAALDRVSLDDTLVMVTADHDHVFTMAGYPTRGNPILGLVRGNDPSGGTSHELTLDGLGKPYTTVGYHNGPGWIGASKGQPEGPKRFPHNNPHWKPGTSGRPDLRKVDTADPRFLQETAMPMASGTHAGHDVLVYAGGPGAHLLHGVREQSYLYHVAVEALGWNRPPSWWKQILGQ